MDVYFYEAFEEEIERLKQLLPAQTQPGFTRNTIQEAGDTNPPAKLISIRTQSIVPSSWAGKLSGVLARTTGYDHVLHLSKSVPCGHLPEYCSRAVAEQAMLMWTALMRKFSQQMEHFARFDRDGLTGEECAGKNLLVVGVGNIGSEIVAIGNGLGMHVRGVDILQRHPSVSYVSIDEGIPWADVIVCAMNLTTENAGYFRYDTLKKAKRGVIFVNIARGELSPTKDLVRLLDEGHLGGVALDVFEDETELAVAMRAGKSSFPLAGRPNVICTPHNAFNTRDAVERKAQQTAQQVAHFLGHNKFLWPVP